MAGNKVASTVLYGMGAEMGHAVFQYSRDRIKGEGDLGRVLDDVLSVRCGGRCLGRKKSTRTGKTVYEFMIGGSPFAYHRKSTEPVLARSQSSASRECASMGDRSCVFEVALE